MNNINATELSYIAGLMDGDGSFSLCKKIEDEKRSPLYYPLIQVSTTYYDVIDLLYNNFGGTIGTRATYIDGRNIKHRESKHWKLEKAPKCIPFLKSMVPYIIGKRKQVDLLIKYIEQNPFVRGSNKLSQDILREREKIYLKMQQLNAEHHEYSLKLPRRSFYHEDPIFWSYVGGLMDTDGSFSLKRTENNYGTYYGPVISLSMLNPQPILHVFKNCPYGNLCLIKAKTSRTGSSFRLSITSLNDSLCFLMHVLDFLKIKKGQATLLYEYCDQKNHKKMNEDIAQEYYMQIVETNKHL